MSAPCRPPRAPRTSRTHRPRAGSMRHDEYLTTINGIAYGSSKAQGIVRDNRFYHADMGITVAFPRGWTIENQRDRLLAFTPKKDAVMQIMIDAKPEKQAPREFLLEQAQGRSRCSRASRSPIDGKEGYTRRHAQRLADRQRRGPGALGRDLSRTERVHLRRREPLGDERRARGRWPVQVGRADAARPQAVGISARRAVSHQDREGDRQDASSPTTRRTCPRTSSRRKPSS